MLTGLVVGVAVTGLVLCFLLWLQVREVSQTSVQATRCAPSSVAVRARSSLSSRTVRLGSRLMVY